MGESIGNSVESNLADQAPAITKLELPTPSTDGETLLHPSFVDVNRLWQANLKSVRVARQHVEILESEVSAISLAQLQDQSRQELLENAIQYGRRYGDFNPPSDSTGFILSGHQPELFHPGVWYKNFVLSHLGQQLGCTAINLVIDNDDCSSPAIQVPQRHNGKPRTAWVPYDGPGYNHPYELRRVSDFDVFRTFEQRASDAIRPFVGSPLVHRLWPQVLEAADSLGSGSGTLLGASIAAGRHRLEWELGLATFEVPLSEICGTHSFMTFVYHVLQNRRSFRDVYNSSLADYREFYGMRSRSHPVPELEQQDEFTEVPFWVWTDSDPVRRRLFVQECDTTLLLSDRQGWSSEIKGKFGADDLMFFEEQGIRIRPRALMTTLYSRLVLSDLFVHGIGGAKYDQLTDLIAQRFFGVSLPGYLTASATFRLPTGTDAVAAEAITEARQRLRQLRYHPECFVDIQAHPQAGVLANEKWDWIEKRKSRVSAQERHRNIQRCNECFQPYLDEDRRRLRQEIDQLKRQLNEREILGSREFSFCLFPENLVEQLLDRSRL